MTDPDLDARLDALAEGVCACGCRTQLRPDGPDPFFINEYHQQAWQLKQAGLPETRTAVTDSREQVAVRIRDLTLRVQAEERASALRTSLSGRQAIADRTLYPGPAAHPAAARLIRAGYDASHNIGDMTWHRLCHTCAAPYQQPEPHLTTISVNIAPTMLGWACPHCHTPGTGPYPTALYRREGPDTKFAICAGREHLAAVCTQASITIRGPAAIWTQLHTNLITRHQWQ